MVTIIPPRPRFRSVVVALILKDRLWRSFKIKRVTGILDVLLRKTLPWVGSRLATGNSAGARYRLLAHLAANPFDSRCPNFKRPLMAVF